MDRVVVAAAAAAASHFLWKMETAIRVAV